MTTARQDRRWQSSSAALRARPMRSQSRRQQSRRQSKRARVRALVLAGTAQLCLFTQAAVLGHILLVPHTRCLEHAELVHEAAHSHTLAPPRQAGAPARGGEVRLGGDPHRPLEDQHCDAIGLHQAPMPQVFEGRLVGTCERLAQAPVDPPGTTSAPAQYRVAPKNSPPRA